MNTKTLITADYAVGDSISVFVDQNHGLGYAVTGKVTGISPTGIVSVEATRNGYTTKWRFSAERGRAIGYNNSSWNRNCPYILRKAEAEQKRADLNRHIRCANHKASVKKKLNDAAAMDPISQRHELFELINEIRALVEGFQP